MPNHPAEYAAATIVASHFGATIDPRDIPGAPPGTHDFDLLLPDGRVIALEITTAADRQTLAVQHQIDPGRQGTPSDKLGSTWIVSVDLPAAKIFPRTLAKAVEGMLQVLEDAGVHEVERMRPDEYTVHPASAAQTASVQAILDSLPTGWNRRLQGQQLPQRRRQVGDHVRSDPSDLLGDTGGA